MSELDIYKRQGFAGSVGIGAQPALVIVDFVLGFTVSFFGGLLVWWMMLIGIGTTFAQFTSPRQRPVRRRLVPRRNLDDRGRVRPA